MMKKNPKAQMSQALLQCVRQLHLPWSTLRVLIGLLALEISLLEREASDRPSLAYRSFPMRLLREWAGLASARDNSAVKGAMPALAESGLVSDVVIDGRMISWQISPLALQLIEEKFDRYSLIDLRQFHALGSAVDFHVYADLLRVRSMRAPRFFYTFGTGPEDICPSWSIFRPKIIRALIALGEVFGCEFHVILATDCATQTIVEAEIRVGITTAKWYKGAYSRVDAGRRSFEVKPATGEVTKLRLSTGF